MSDTVTILLKYNYNCMNHHCDMQLQTCKNEDHREYEAKAYLPKVYIGVLPLNMGNSRKERMGK